MSYEQFIMRSIFTWGAILIGCTIFLTQGFWQGAVIFLAICSPIYLITWKAGVKEALWYKERE